MPVHPTSLAPGKFRHVGVFLLGHDGGARAETVGQFDEAVATGHPKNKLLGQPRDMGHDQRAGGGELNGKVTVAYSIKRVLAQGLKAQRFCHPLPVNGVACTGKRGRTQGQSVHSATRVHQPLVVTRKHGLVGEHVMAKAYGLSHLKMGKARHDGLGMGLGLANKSKP